jgi:hypothetical protein
MSNLYRGPSIDASYQVSVHLVKWFQRRRFLKISQSETRIACGGHVCPIPVKTDVGQVDLVLRLSDGTSEKIRDSQTCRLRWTNLFPLV